MSNPVSAQLYGLGVGTASLTNLGAIPYITTRDPTTTDVKGPNGPWKLGQPWVNKSDQSVWFLVSQSSLGGSLSSTWVGAGGGTGAVNTLSSDSGSATPVSGDIDIAGGSNISTSATGATLTVALDNTITGLTSLSSTALIGTTVTGTSFETANSAAGSTLSDDSWVADGTDANIDLTITPKGSGTTRVGSFLYLPTPGTGIGITAQAVTDFMGSAQLSSGSVTVANTNILDTDVILMSYVGALSNPGILTYSIVDGTSFTITSSDGTDASQVTYLILRSL